MMGEFNSNLTVQYCHHIYLYFSNVFFFFIFTSIPNLGFPMMGTCNVQW